MGLHATKKRLELEKLDLIALLSTGSFSEIARDLNTTTTMLNTLITQQFRDRAKKTKSTIRNENKMNFEGSWMNSEARVIIRKIKYNEN